MLLFRLILLLRSQLLLLLVPLRSVAALTLDFWITVVPSLIQRRRIGTARSVARGRVCIAHFFLFFSICGEKVFSFLLSLSGQHTLSNRVAAVSACVFGYGRRRTTATPMTEVGREKWGKPLKSFSLSLFRPQSCTTTTTKRWYFFLQYNNTTVIIVRKSRQKETLKFNHN